MDCDFAELLTLSASRAISAVAEFLVLENFNIMLSGSGYSKGDT